MRKSICFFFLFLAFKFGHASTKTALQQDLSFILNDAQFSNDLIDFQLKTVDKTNTIRIQCGPKNLVLIVQAERTEIISSFYYGLHRLGFLFPHPRVQISPRYSEIRKECGKTFTWRPSLPIRGFHLHTQHPSEWVAGFFMNKDPEAGEDIVRWHARNFQNVLQVQFLRGSLEHYSSFFYKPLQLAKDLGIRVGLSVSFSMIQQKSYKLLPLWSALTGWNTEAEITAQIDQFVRYFNFDFMTVELGSSEFTPIYYSKTIEWLNFTSKALRSRNKFLMTKVHTSTNQFSKKYGNYNFLPQYAETHVGILPHTVMYYGLKDEQAPVYERQNFSDIYEFLLKEKEKRPTWYYPETSYFIAMDIDVPSFLTDYIRTRVKDFELIVENQVGGHLNFTTGQELGYWLIDWSVALQANREYLGNEFIALQLLNEDLKVWQKIFDFQTRYIKEPLLLSEISSSQLLDEFAIFGQIHKRVLIRDLAKNKSYLLTQISNLNSAVENLPSVAEIRNSELKIMIEVTFKRLQHALFIRRGLLARLNNEDDHFWYEKAKNIRALATVDMSGLVKKYNRYPRAQIFEEFKNPTSYDFGYGWTASTLHFWEREEKMAQLDIKNPFYMNIYSVYDLLF